MKKLLFLLSAVLYLSVFLFSCNKDTTVTQGGSTTGTQTQSFSSNPALNKFITNSAPVFDTINANISDNILSNNISDVKIALGDVSGVEVDKIKFSLLHNGIEVAVIDALTKTGVGNFTNTVLSDSSNIPIDQGQSPYTGIFKPQHPLGSFFNEEPAGQWIIKITYSGSMRTGVIKSWSITITYSPVLQTPVLTSAYFPSVNDNWKFKRADTTNPYFKVSGENVTWDFSNLTVNNSFEYTDEYISATVSPLQWHFPQSNIAKRNFSLNGNYLSFFKTDFINGKYLFYGEADSNSIDGFKIYELIPFLYFAWTPLTYNSMRIDSGLTHNINTSVTSHGKFLDTTKADGWGRILLPGGSSYNSVLRERIVIATIDTINGTTLSYSYSEVINWIAVGFKFPVLQYNFSIRYSAVSGSSWTKVVNFTTQNVPIGK